MRSASVVAPIVCDLVHPESVLDMGCGQGEWVETFAEQVPDVYGVDIAAPEAEGYEKRDLTQPVDLGRRFDLVVSLEVAEHLPEDAADVFVENVTRHGDKVLFSAAVPGQAGNGHINCQPHEYWHERFAEHGFTATDEIRPRIAHDTRVSPWYRNNTFLYTR